ncbi:MAG: NAD(P)-dependent oxidoreductase [Phycisphaeraceae bacterium]|nr:NAD(P)-dependent oxidoreductase [Phycisphaeraceae bacterium]
MKLLVVGGAGYVGSIVRLVLEAEHECVHYDLQPVAGAEGRTILADVNDEDRVKTAIAGMEGILYMPLGSRSGDRRTASQIDPAFDVNVKGLYRFLSAGLSAGVSWFCYVSSMSVYGASVRSPRATPLSERDPADARDTYGISKRVGEYLCQVYADLYPQATIISLRLNQPMNEDDWARWQETHDSGRVSVWGPPIGPQANRALFAAALRFHQSGHYAINVYGTRDGRRFDLGTAKNLLNWEPIPA